MLIFFFLDISQFVEIAQQVAVAQPEPETPIPKLRNKWRLHNPIPKSWIRNWLQNPTPKFFQQVAVAEAEPEFRIPKSIPSLYNHLSSSVYYIECLESINVITILLLSIVWYNNKTELDYIKYISINILNFIPMFTGTPAHQLQKWLTAMMKFARHLSIANFHH